MLQDWAFSQRKYLPYELKIELSCRRIRDWSDNHENVYISFSGGLDSTVLVHMVERALSRSVPKVFVNTGLEFSEIRDFVHAFENVEEIRPDIGFKDILMTHGYPLVSKEVAAKIRKLRHGDLSSKYRNYLLYGDERGKLGKLSECWKFLINAPFDTSEECCLFTKERPLLKYAKEHNSVPYIGITQDEGFMRQRQYNRTGCNVYNAKHPKSQPLGFWTKQDILRYVVENNIRICSVYGKILIKNGLYFTTGEQRTGCVYCAMGCHLEKEPNRYQRLKEIDRKKYEFVMRPISLDGLGFGYVLDYCNIVH